MLRVATDRRAWPDDLPVVPLLEPLLDAPGGPASMPRPGATGWDHRFERWTDRARSRIELVEVADADVVVLPGDWYWVRGTSWRTRPRADLIAGVRPLHDAARRAGVPVVAFFTGDRSCDRVPLADVHVFREGPFASRLGPLDHVLPAFPEDLVDHHLGALVERPWSERPTVGFCGLARSAPTWRRVLGDVAFHAVVAARERHLDPSPHLGELLRAEAIGVLERSPEVETNFVLRQRKEFFRDADTRDLVDVRREYVENLRDSDYVLCIRGSGNYSYRLYETMCAGRVPIVVDTDLALPAPDRVDWDRLSVRVDRADLADLPGRVRAFHESLAPTAFVALQHELRDAWREHLSPEGFFDRFATTWPRRDDRGT